MEQSASGGMTIGWNENSIQGPYESDGVQCSEHIMEIGSQVRGYTRLAFSGPLFVLLFVPHDLTCTLLVRVLQLRVPLIAVVSGGLQTMSQNNSSEDDTRSPLSETAKWCATKLNRCWAGK